MQPVALSSKRYGGRFETEKEIGHGGMGLVYRARDLQSGGLVALKVLYEREGPNAERFSQEAAMLAELSHPAIVHYVHHGVSAGGEHYLAMEWLEGRTLEESLAVDRLPIAASLDMGARLLDGLSVAHRRGVVHRDLKPANVLLPDGKLANAKLLDFGIARRLFDGRRLTRVGATVGTPMYMSPEQARGVAEVDARSDIFSLGCVLFECLTGQAPFTAETPVAVLAKICLEEAPSLRTLRPDLPHVVDALVRSMLEKQPDKRPSDTSALARTMSGLADQIRRGEVGQTGEDDLADITITPSEQRLFTAVLVQLPRKGPKPSPAGRLAALESSADLSGAVDPTGALATPTPLALTAIRGLWRRKSATRVPAPPTPTSAPAGATPAESVGLTSEQMVPDLYDDAVMAKVQRAAAPFRVQVERFYNDSLALTRPEGPNTLEQTVNMARCVLQLKLLLPSASFAVASARSDGETVVPVGRVLERAGSLLVGLGPGAIRMDTLTSDLLHTRFEVTAPEPPPSNVRRLLHEKGMAEPPRTLVGRPVPFIGREREVNTLHSMFAEVADDSVARAIIVTGGGGVGKSRLLHTLLDRMYQHGTVFELLAGRGEAMRAGQAWSMLGSALRSAANVSGFEAMEVRRKRFEAHMGRHIADPGRRQRIVAFLGEIASIHFPDDDFPMLKSARQDPRAMSDQTRAAWMDWVEAELEVGPVALVFEDLHYGDVASFMLVDHVLRLFPNKPLFVAGFGRQEVKEKYPALWEAHGVEHLGIAPLKPKVAKLFVQGIWPEANEAQLEFVVGKAGGNPFFLEELVRVALERGPEALSSTPFSVLAVLQDRLDFVGERGKRVLRAASVFGMRCRRSGVAALLGETDLKEMEVWLDMLAKHEILFCETTGAAREYVFRQALLREASYATLTDKDRVAAHGAAGNFLEKAGAENAVELAEHFVCGEQLPRAGHWFRVAAERELAASELDAGLMSCARAEACGVEGTELGLVRLVEARLRFWKGEGELSRVAAEEAVGLLEGVSHMEALAELANAYGHLAFEQGQREAVKCYERTFDLLMGSHARTAEHDRWLINAFRVGTYETVLGTSVHSSALAELAEEAASSSNHMLSAAACRFLNCLESRRLHYPKALTFYRLAGEAFKRAGNLHEAVMNDAGMLSMLENAALLGEAADLGPQLYADAKRQGLFYLEDIIACNLAKCLLELGDGTEAKRWAKTAFDGASKRSNLRVEAYAAMVGARASLLLVELDEAAKQVEQAKSAQELAAMAMPSLLAVEALVHIGLGDIHAAIDCASKAEADLSAFGEDYSLDALFVWVAICQVYTAASRPLERSRALAKAQVCRREQQLNGGVTKPYLYGQIKAVEALAEP